MAAVIACNSVDPKHVLVCGKSPEGTLSALRPHRRSPSLLPGAAGNEQPPLT